MPEGDTVAVAAVALQGALTGATIEGVGGSHPEIVRTGQRIQGSAVSEVTSYGKHLLVHFDNHWSLRVHLGMTGSWHLYRPGERWWTEPGKARVVLETATVVAVCFAAPTVSLGPTDRVTKEVAHLGPDLLDGDADFAAIMERAEASEAPTVADLLLDQRVAAGIGNVYKSEVLFLEKAHPSTPPQQLGPERIEGMYRRAARLLQANRRPGPRTTTGDRRRDHWVYGHGGWPCPRCGATIESADLGTPPRLTYWCPGCAPRI